MANPLMGRDSDFLKRCGLILYFNPMQVTYPHVLRTLSLFAGLSESERGRLVQTGKVRRYKAGENLFHYGDPVAQFYIVCDGAVQLFRETADGHEVTSDVQIAGEI